jgi:hypothetical protein
MRAVQPTFPASMAPSRAQVGIRIECIQRDIDSEDWVTRQAFPREFTVCERISPHIHVLQALFLSFCH